MIFSKRCTYGIRAMLELISVYPEGRMKIRDISDATGIPRKFLEQVLLTLKKGGMLGSKMGNEGGYYLNKNPGSVSLSDIIMILDGPLEFAECMKTQYRCEKEETCKLHVFIDKLQSKMENLLVSFTIKDIYDMPLEKGVVNFEI